MGHPTAEDVERFVQRVKFRAYDDHYVDADEEKEILKEGIDAGLDLDDAQAMLRQACARHGFAQESMIKSTLEVILERFCENDGKIDLKEFNDGVAIAFKLLKRDAPRTNVMERDMELLAHAIIARRRYAVQRALKGYLKKNFDLDA